MAGFIDATQRWLSTAATAATPNPAANLRVEVSVGALDSRLRLAPCRQMEPFLPTGTRLWGKTRIGLRCTDRSANWTVFMPLTVKAYGKGWVLKRAMPSGSVLGVDDVQEAEVDWAEDPSPILADPAQWLGQLSAHPLLAGQALRTSMVRPAALFQMGALVRVVANGGGFSVMSEGQSLGAGILGQTARVKLENGKIVAGTVVDAHTVKFDL